MKRFLCGMLLIGIFAFAAAGEERKVIRPGELGPGGKRVVGGGEPGGIQSGVGLKKVTTGMPGGGQLLTDEQLAKLQPVYEEEGRKLQLTAALSETWTGLPEKEFERLMKDGRVPFKLTASLVEMRTEKSGSFSQQFLPGRLAFYMLDPDGNVILREAAVSFDKIGGKNAKGIKGVAPKPGKYKIVLWTDSKKGRLGMVLDENLRVPPAKKK